MTEEKTIGSRIAAARTLAGLDHDVVVRRLLERGFTLQRGDEPTIPWLQGIERGDWRPTLAALAAIAAVIPNTDPGELAFGARGHSEDSDFVRAMRALDAPLEADSNAKGALLHLAYYYTRADRTAQTAEEAESTSSGAASLEPPA